MPKFTLHAKYDVKDCEGMNKLDSHILILITNTAAFFGLETIVWDSLGHPPRQWIVMAPLGDVTHAAINPLGSVIFTKQICQSVCNKAYPP